MRSLKSLAALALPIALSTCGLPSSYYLTPPGQISTSSGTGPFYVVCNTSNNEPALRGFDLYYKFFATDTSVQSTLQGSSYTTTDLTNAGFKPILRDTDSSSRAIPLIQIPTSTIGTYFAIEFTFATQGGTFSYVTNNPSVAVTNPTTYGAPTEMRRNVIDTFAGDATYGFPKKFDVSNSLGSFNYTSSDADFSDSSLSSVLASNFSSPAYLAIYAVTVAYDSSQGYYYSYPIYLGYFAVYRS